MVSVRQNAQISVLSYHLTKLGVIGRQCSLSFSAQLDGALPLMGTTPSPACGSIATRTKGAGNLLFVSGGGGMLCRAGWSYAWAAAHLKRESEDY